MIDSNRLMVGIVNYLKFTGYNTIENQKALFEYLTDKNATDFNFSLLNKFYHVQISEYEYLTQQEFNSLTKSLCDFSMAELVHLTDFFLTEDEQELIHFYSHSVAKNIIVLSILLNIRSIKQLQQIMLGLKTKTKLSYFTTKEGDIDYYLIVFNTLSQETTFQPTTDQENLHEQLYEVQAVFIQDFYRVDKSVVKPLLNQVYDVLVVMLANLIGKRGKKVKITNKYLKQYAMNVQAIYIESVKDMLLFNCFNCEEAEFPGNIHDVLKMINSYMLKLEDDQQAIVRNNSLTVSGIEHSDKKEDEAPGPREPLEEVRGTTRNVAPGDGE